MELYLALVVVPRTHSVVVVFPPNHPVIVVSLQNYPAAVSISSYPVVVLTQFFLLLLYQSKIILLSRISTKLPVAVLSQIIVSLYQSKNIPSLLYQVVLLFLYQN